VNDILFLSHGGGPLPLLGDPAHREMVDCLQTIASQIKRPSAILLVSAHWEANIPSITSGNNPCLIYDYYGFPEEAYRLQYACPGEPALAERVYAALTGTGLKARMDSERGFDHGLFVPLMIMYPDADIPCVQLSLVNDLDPWHHIQMGRALSQLDDDRVLIIGSGFSFHNMKAFLDRDRKSSDRNRAFESWLIDTVANRDLSEAQRAERLRHWDAAPYARFCHPREEHLLPLHVCYGAAERACSEYFELNVVNKKSSMFLWSDAAW
jgi:aromatic ring-opening dioxygenase catalytic subunit (LigB family)